MISCEDILVILQPLDSHEDRRHHLRHRWPRVLSLCTTVLQPPRHPLRLANHVRACRRSRRRAVARWANIILLPRRRQEDR